MSTIRQRVVEEHAEVLQRLSKLKRFLGTAPYMALSPENRRLLDSQAAVMQQYVTILEERLRIMVK